MEKTLTYDEQVKIKNLLTSIKCNTHQMKLSQEEINSKVDQIREILK